jgi:hypothetical protein
MAKKPEISEEEIDLGTLFSQIGKLFSNFFSFLGSILKNLLDYSILLLLFLKKHLLELGLAAVIGAVVGFFINIIIPENYHYDMIVQPNYDAAYQMNERIQYYNDLIKNEDSVRLAKLFNIDFDDANSLTEFEMRRQEEKRDIIESYNEFIKDKDSLTKLEISFDDYLDEEFSFFDSEYYAFRMSLKKERLKRNIQQELIADLENNPHLQKERKLTLARLETKEKNLLKTIRDIDSLRATYKEVALLTAKNMSNTGTAIDIVDSKKTNDNDIRLFNVYKDAYKNLDTLLVEKQKKQDIFKIVTPFKPLGIAQTKVVEKKTVLVSLIFFGLMLLFILLKDLNSYLESYKKES